MRPASPPARPGNFLLALAFTLLPLSAFALSGHEIMERVEDNQRAISDSAFNRIQLSSCRYGLQNNQITCVERPRVKLLESVGINTGPEKRDTRTVTIVREPAAERGGRHAHLLLRRAGS